VAFSRDAAAQGRALLLQYDATVPS
jgi:hypothetical protein